MLRFVPVSNSSSRGSSLIYIYLQKGGEKLEAESYRAREVGQETGGEGTRERHGSVFGVGEGAKRSFLREFSELLYGKTKETSRRETPRLCTNRGVCTGRG